MAVTVVDGNIFKTKCQTIVNTVNCVGVMGAGIALECRFRWPDMFQTYVDLCKKEQMKIGLLWLYKSPDRWVLNFPTKDHWKDPSREEYLHLGLEKFQRSYRQKQIESIAFPLLGAQNGRIDRERSLEIMEFYLRQCAIPVEIYCHDPAAPDDLLEHVRSALSGRTATELKEVLGIRADQAERVLLALQDASICQLNRLASVSGIGSKTLEKVFFFARQQTTAKVPDTVQQTLEF